MAAPKQQVIADIRAFIERCRGACRGWYVGIASDPRSRLFGDHGVDEKGDMWIYRECESAVLAREVEEFFVKMIGTDGGLGGGDESTRWVYAYKKAPHTVPRAG